MSIEKEEIGRYVRRDVAWVDGDTSLREVIVKMLSGTSMLSWCGRRAR